MVIYLEISECSCIKEIVLDWRIGYSGEERLASLMKLRHHAFKKIDDTFGSTIISEIPPIVWVYQRLKRLSRKSVPKNIQEISYSGYSLCINPRYYIGEDLLIYGEYEPFISETISELVSDGDTVVDVGAHVGHHTLTMRQNVGHSGSVHLFEPHPQLYPLLEKTIENNDFKNVHLHRNALTEEKDLFTLQVGKDSNNLGSSSLLSQNQTSIEYDVEGVRFDEFVGEKLGVESIQLVKIDVEGYERHVISGIGDMIDSIDYLLLEWHHFALSSTEENKLLEHLLNHGSIVDIENDRAINSSADFVDQKRTHILWCREGVENPNSFST